jgi:hypothetical protein
MILARSNGKQNWTRVTKSNPCPICNKPDNCSISIDGGAVWCGRVESSKQNSGGQWLHKLSDENRPASFVHPSHKRKEKPKRTDWPEVSQALSSCDPVRIDQLSSRLIVPQWALSDLGCGWGSIDDWKTHQVNASTDAYSMPERSADGVVIGINRRFPNGKKIHAQGGSRGLTFSADWSTLQPQTLCVEGFSCTSAAVAMGLSVVGRPGAAAGADHLVELFREHDQQIVILAERDENGAGERGAVSIAKRLADELGRVVHWSFPPESAQDVRSWLNKCDPLAHKRSRGDLDPLGVRFLSGLDIKPVQPDRPAVEQFEPLSGSLVELSDWREQMKSARIESLGNPGLYFDSSPTGSGKSYAAAEAMRQADRSLYVQPTHANCIEEQSKLQAAGLNARAIPELNESSCQNWKEARNAMQSGISASAAVCPRCPFHNSCEFISNVSEALSASVTICTHARAERQMGKLSENRNLVIIEEDPTNLIRPTISVDPRELAMLENVFQEAKAFAWDIKNYELYDFIDKAEALSGELSDGCRTAKQTRATPLPAPIQAPKHLEMHLWRAMKLVVGDGTNNLTAPVDPQCVQLVIGILTGTIDRLVIQVDHPHKSRDERYRICMLVGSSRTKMPQSIPTWFNDATGSAKSIGDLCGQAVSDRTPDGILANQKAIKQLPRDITNKTDPAMVAANIEGWMRQNPNAKKVGIILWKNHRSALFGKRSEILTDETRSRIHLVTHFGSGTDRASNEWMNCDALLILGTFRPNQSADKSKLIQLGKITAAADREQGGWGLRRWEGRTASGALILVDGLGYSDPDWRTAREHLCRSAMLQAVGRGRAILADGIHVWIFSTEPLGPNIELVDPVEMRPLKRAILEASEAVSHYFQNPISTNIREWKYPEPVQTKQIAADLGVSPSCATKRLQAAQDAGLVARSTSHKGGWIWTGPTPIETPDTPSENTSAEIPSRESSPRKQTPPPRNISPAITWQRAEQLAAAIPGVDLGTNLPEPEQ